MARKKKPKIISEGSKSTIQLESGPRFAGPNPAAKMPGAGQHGGTIEQKNRRERRQSKKELKSWEA